VVPAKSKPALTRQTIVARPRNFFNISVHPFKVAYTNYSIYDQPEG
jgi:hypothetical protein